MNAHSARNFITYSNLSWRDFYEQNSFRLLFQVTSLD